MAAETEVEAVVDWYLKTAYGRWEGPGVTPFFADRSRVGHFAVELTLVERGDPATLFRLLVMIAMFQSRRDVDIMAILRGMPARTVADLTSPSRLRVLTDGSSCDHLRSSTALVNSCDVARAGRSATCASRPELRCHVKEATSAIGRMGDMGKLPSSAWLTLGKAGVSGAVERACQDELSPPKRADQLVAELSRIHRIGRKLASLYVSALSTPELGVVAPWRPRIDGSRLVVVDGNVAAAVAIWRGPRARRTYDATATWISKVADTMERRRNPALSPRLSPRFVQQAMYVFRSRFNRVAAHDGCATRRCSSCPSRVCPFRQT